MHFWYTALLIIALIFTSFPPQDVSAERGAPGSTEFGYGTQINLNGPYVIEGIRLANEMQLDWLAFDLSWQSLAPKQGAIDWTRLDTVSKALDQSQTRLMISLIEPPQWALNAQGPDPLQVSQFVTQLIQHFPKSLGAIELFPNANTRSGWGRTPDPKAYIKVWNTVASSLQLLKSQVLLIAGGLKPVSAGENSMDVMEDLVFLQGLYSAGAAAVMPVISINAFELTGDTLQAPTKEQNKVLRHYEEIRQIMVANQHEKGLIWINHLISPKNHSTANDQIYKELVNQSNWMSRALIQLRSQLYIGVVFSGEMNPSPTCTANCPSIIQINGDYHPFYRSLRDTVSASHSGNPNSRPGRAKNQPLMKSSK